MANEESLAVGPGVEEGEIWGVGGHGLLRDMTVSVPPSQKLESLMLAGEPGRGSPAGRVGAVWLLPGLGGLFVFSGRVGCIAAKRRRQRRITV